jgi:hypothetical protein
MEDILRRRGIREILHFTTNLGAVGVLDDRELLARARLPREKHLGNVYRPNARIRYDKAWLNYVNLSISRINRRFFQASTTWHWARDVWWCVLAFDPIVAAHDGVHFATTNNFYSGCIQAAGAAGLEALFGPRIHQYENRYVTRPEGHPRHLPTCRQAELLYPQALSTRYLRRICVVSDVHADIAAGWCDLVGHDDVPVEVLPVVFE